MSGPLKGAIVAAMGALMLSILMIWMNKTDPNEGENLSNHARSINETALIALNMPALPIVQLASNATSEHWPFSLIFLSFAGTIVIGFLFYAHSAKNRLGFAGTSAVAGGLVFCIFSNYWGHNPLLVFSPVAWLGLCLLIDIRIWRQLCRVPHSERDDCRAKGG